MAVDVAVVAREIAPAVDLQEYLADRDRRHELRLAAVTYHRIRGSQADDEPSALWNADILLRSRSRRSICRCRTGRSLRSAIGTSLTLQRSVGMLGSAVTVMRTSQWTMAN